MAGNEKEMKPKDTKAQRKIKKILCLCAFTLKKCLGLITIPVYGCLLLFTLRRWLFMLTVLFIKSLRASVSGPPVPDRGVRADKMFALPGFTPSVLLLVPFRNEAENLPPLLKALKNLSYPIHQLNIVFIDDGSTDGGATQLLPDCEKNENWHLLSLPQNVGKAQALNLACQQFSQGQVIAVYDVDERPQAQALIQLAQPFQQTRVGAVSGRRMVSNSVASPVSSYISFENLVHQLITTQAKDILRLAPPILGSNCAYRRSALEAVGGFQVGALLEDSELTVRLARQGWQTRFVPQAISRHAVPVTLRGYWRQHVRWARGFQAVSGDRCQVSGVRCQEAGDWKLKLELALFSMGYLDRVALVLGIVLVGIRYQVSGVRGRRAREQRGKGAGGQGSGKLKTGNCLLPPTSYLLLLHLLTPFLQTILALKLSYAPLALWRRLIWLPVFFGVDILMALYSTLAGLLKRPQIWEERAQR